ncbi:class I SAM-dependent methyltransferase [Flavobacterium sp. ZT3R18]|uniref:class I SAM-dependent methyltransferase n=1 Tax=Flavobacterium sp. ZT3R18 TaxID=2594429 RepID=UPI00163DA7F8|nr:class I SAM-dependent methyltransferase [Flavobacterium sp. ZT3R18]
MYLEWFPNEKILDEFYNPIKSYSRERSKKVIDIGCGQSQYLIDLLESDFELFAVDTEKSQLNFLEERVKQFGYQKDRITYSSKEFPSEDFEGLFFSAIIVSNLLHFFTKPEAYIFVEGLSKYCDSDSLILITVHSSDHLSNKEKITSSSYFKSFYSKKDLYEMFPNTEYEYVSYVEKEKEPSNYKKQFLMHWINEYYKEKYLPFQIQKIQEDYLKTCRINSIDFVVRKR